MGDPEGDPDLENYSHTGWTERRVVQAEYYEPNILQSMTCTTLNPKPQSLNPHPESLNPTP